MNDFTKEELQIIHLDICTYINKAGVLKVPQHHIALRDKIELMIENYKETIMVRGEERKLSEFIDE